jgi:osmotically inducible protein OsmC
VTIVKGDKGFDITKSALSLRADVPGIDRAKFEELARTAEKNCPVSKVLKAEITMDFTLAQAAA